MSKRIALTERIRSLISRQAGGDIDFTKIAVYESVTASTRPISQGSTIYNDAVMTQSFLQQMADHLNEETVPIQAMHNNHLLPVGKVIEAKVLEAEQGHYDLNALFYIKADSEYAEDIDLGIIDEVSVGALPKTAFCSECGFDYMAEGNEMNLWLRECDNGHELGKNGVHLRLTELSSWKELSLVNKGASDKPKILGTSKQRLSKESYERLAASASSPEAANFAYLLCSATPTPPKDKGDDMDLTALTEQVANLSADKAKLEVTLQSTEGTLQETKTQLDAAGTRITELETELEASKDTELKKQVETLTAQLAAQKDAIAFLKEQGAIAATAAGIELAEDADLNQLMEVVKQAQVKLAAIPRGGVTLGSELKDADSSVDVQRNSAFIASR